MKLHLACLAFAILLSAAKCSAPENDAMAENATTDQLEADLHEVAGDSAEEIAALQQEIALRLEDSTYRYESVKLLDSAMVLGDTISWHVTQRTIKRNKLLQQYATDTLKKLLRKKVIYPEGGGDNRKDWYQLSIESRERTTALQTACLIKRNKIYQRADGNFELRTRVFSEARNLCTAERFYNQPVAGFCSGFGVSDNLFVTAGHCVETQTDLHSFYVVYNFNQENVNQTRVIFTPDEVYTPIELVHRRDDDGKDFAVIRLDRTIPATRQVVLRTTDVRKDEPVFVIGYPCGLPLKYADGARVVDTSSADFFLANLDTYGGNSGSPVFDDSHQVVGILVRGARDFQFNATDKCFYSNVCTALGTPECAGEGVSRVTQFQQFILN